MSKVLSPKDKLYRQILGSMSKRKGRSNEDKSIQHILDNYTIYSVPDMSHIYKTPRGTRHHTDLFYTTYIDNKGIKQKAGFDIMAIPDKDSYNEDGTIYSYCHLVQVKSTKLPDTLYIKALQEYKVSEFIKKYLHIWVDDELQILPL